MAERTTLVVCEGDETGQELLEQALRVLDPDVLGIPIELRRFDLSLGQPAADPDRWSTRPPRRCVETGLGLKAATITPRDRRRRARRTASCGKGSAARSSCAPDDGPRRDPTGAGAPIVVVRMAVGRRLRRHGGPDGDAGRAGRGVPHRADRTGDLPGGGRVLVPDGRRAWMGGLRRPQVDGVDHLRGHAERGDGRGSRPPPRGPLPTDADRRRLCRPPDRSGRPAHSSSLR